MKDGSTKQMNTLTIRAALEGSLSRGSDACFGGPMLDLSAAIRIACICRDEGYLPIICDVFGDRGSKICYAVATHRTLKNHEVIN